MNRGTGVFYVSLLGFILAVLASMPFISVDISIRSPGIVRPAQERTEVKSLIAGQIERIFYPEGAAIRKDAVFIRLRDNSSLPKKRLNLFELQQSRERIHDLEVLTGAPRITQAVTRLLQSPVYRQQALGFLNQLTGQEVVLKKAARDLETNRYLAQEKVIARKELLDQAAEHERLDAGYHALLREQYYKWQQELSRCRLEHSQLQAQQQQLHQESRLYDIVAPVTGTILGLDGRYTGSMVQAGEPICTISPETDLVAECYVTTRNAGLLHTGQPVTFRVDAFNSSYFGMLTGNVKSIDNDFTLVNNEPAFKVRCTFSKTQVHLKNGYTGQLKKGLTLQAGFVIASRTLWQLLSDTINDWMDPAGQSSIPKIQRIEKAG